MREGSRSFPGWPTMLCAVGLAGVALFAASPSRAQLVSPFGVESIKLSDADRKLMDAAILSVLQERRVGATETWRSESSGQGGTAMVLRVFERGNHPCAEVEHVFTSGGRSRFTLPFCRMEDGDWQIAF